MTRFSKRINIQTLPSVHITDIKGLPKCSGVYFLYDETGVIYIGKSGGIKSRWGNSHRVYRQQVNNRFARIAWVEVGSSSLDKFESDAIKHFNPFLNNNTAGVGASVLDNQKTAAYSLREKLIAYYETRKPDGGKVQEVMAKEIPLAYSTLNRYLTRSVAIKGLGYMAVENYLERMSSE